METPGCLIILCSVPSRLLCLQSWLTDMCSASQGCEDTWLFYMAGRGGGEPRVFNWSASLHTHTHLNKHTHAYIQTSLQAMRGYFTLLYELTGEMIIKDKWFNSERADVNFGQMPDFIVLTSCMWFHAVSPDLQYHTYLGVWYSLWTRGVCWRSSRTSRINPVHNTVLHTCQFHWRLQHVCVRLI